MAYISGTKIFPNMGFVQEHSKFLVHFCNFWGNKFFPGKSGLSHTTSYGFIAPCQNLEKANNAIQRKHTDKWKDWKTDRPYFIRPFPLPLGVQKRDLQLVPLTYFLHNFWKTILTSNSTNTPNCLIVFTSWDIGQYVYCNYLSPNSWRHKCWH